MPIKFPDEETAMLQMSLEEFTVKAQALCEADHGRAFVDFTLAGRMKEPESTRVFVNAIEGAVSFTREVMQNMTVRRDYDSLIGISTNLPFTKALALTPIPSFRDTLTKNNHIDGVAWSRDSGQRIKVPMSNVPNIGLGYVGKRHVTRVFFPRLYDPRGDPKLSQENLAKYYNDCLRKTYDEINPAAVYRLPRDYQIGLLHSKDQRGNINTASYDVSAYDLREFGEALLRRLNDIPVFEDAYFVHELRGTKGATSHDPYNDDEIAEALDDLLSFTDRDQIAEGQWYIDVGLEISLPHHVVHWRTDSHCALIQHAMPTLTEEEVERLHGGKRYKLDRSAQLKDLAGFRMEVSPKYAPHTGVTYLNVYPTEKAVIYQLHSGLWRRRKASDLFPGSVKKLLGDLDQMSHVLAKCSTEEGGIDSSARFEVRMKLSQAKDSVKYFPASLVRQCVIAIPTQTWWMFKFYRLSALYSLVRSLSEAPADARIWNASLALGALVIYMINALSYREAEGRREKALLDACSQHIITDTDFDTYDDDDDDVAMHPIHHDRGLWFISGIAYDYSPRLSPKRLPEFRMVALFYDKVNKDQIEAVFGVTGIFVDPEEAPHISRVPNKGQTTSLIDERLLEVTVDALPAGGLNLTALGIILHPSASMGGPDIDELGAERDLSDDDEQNPDNVVKYIWAQMPSDIFARSANRKSAEEPSYVLLSPQDRWDATFSIFTTLDFTGIFAVIHVRPCTKADWDQQFERYFPKKGTVARQRGKLQNFPYCNYFRKWRKFLNRLSDNDAEIARTETRKVFNTLWWLPWADTDKMWVTKQKGAKNSFILPHDALKGPCPQIAINTRIANVDDIVINTGRFEQRHSPSVDVGREEEAPRPRSPDIFGGNGLHRMRRSDAGEIPRGEATLTDESGHFKDYLELYREEEEESE